jgi:glycosyltransferase involved in cell wall biosynthesis
MVEALAALSKSIDNVRLLFVGDGNLRQNVEALIAKYGLENQVLVAGIRGSERVATYLKGADVFVLSSDYEGMPMCVLEALACGLPVASTDVGEVALVVSPGVNGELLSVHEPEQLADSMGRCLRNAERYRGRHCTDAIQDFLPEKVLKPIYENYQKLAAEGRRQI